MAAAASGGTPAVAAAGAPRILKLPDPLLLLLLLLMEFPCAATGGKMGSGYCPPTAPLLLLLLWPLKNANGLTNPPAAESAEAADLAALLLSFPASNTPGAELRKGFCLAGGTAKGL
jgi:hypothetical protein